MESFADKVRYGAGTRFDPMMEERGGWIAGEAQPQDAVMTDAVIEVLVEANQQIEGKNPNPFKGYKGEVLPSNMERSFSGFLVRKDAIKFQVNTEKLLACIAELKNQLLICKFIGSNPPPHAMKLWIQALNQELRGSTLSFSRNVGKGYFILSSEDEDALSNALMLTAFRSKWGTCMLQTWVPGFNPENPSNLAFPTWVSLRNMPFEHQDQALAIAESLGEVIGLDTTNDYAKDPRFCVNLEISKGWVTCIDLESEGGIVASQKIMVDYDKLPIRCRTCLSWKHKASECKDAMRRPQYRREKDRSMLPHSFQQTEKGKTIATDEDGFQQVQHRKNTRRNIFDKNIMFSNYNKDDARPQSPNQTTRAAATAAAHENQGGSETTNKDAVQVGSQGNVEGNLREPPYTRCKITEKAVVAGATRDKDGANQTATSASLDRRTNTENTTCKADHACEDLDQEMREAEAPTERWRYVAEGSQSPTGAEAERLITEPSGDRRRPVRGKSAVQEVGMTANTTAESGEAEAGNAVRIGETVHAGGDFGGSWANAGGNPETEVSLNIGGEAESREPEKGGGKPSDIETSNPQEGRGDPTSTMLWSPERLAGHK